MRNASLKFLLLLLLFMISIGIYQASPTPTHASSVDLSQVDAGWIDRLGESEIANRLELLQDVRQFQAPVTSAEAQESEGVWTILIYMAADNNLESFALKDMAELEFWGSSQDVRVIVQIDRSDAFDTTDGNWTEARRYFITSDFGVSISSIDSELVGEVGEVNTGDPDALVDFATWAIDTYPSENYALVLWNHGGSWFGAASDDSHDGDELTLTEIDEALGAIREQTGRDQFELVGFDACLMGALEVYETLAPHAEYAIASPELVPGNGWEYTMLLSDLQLNPNQTPSEVGHGIVDRFMEFYTVQVSNYDVFSMSLIDLSHAEALNAELQSFTNQFNLDPERALEIVSRVRGETLVHGGFDDPQYIDVWAAVDLVQLMDAIARDPTYPELARAAQKVVNVSRNFVSYHRGNGPFAETGGLSIYFPRTVNLYQRRGRNELYAAETPERLATWRDFLDTYYSTAVATGLQQLPTEGQVTGGRSGQQRVLLDLGLQGTGIVNAGFYVTYIAEDGLPVLIDFDRVGISSQQQIRWVPQIPIISDGENEVPILLVVNRTNPDQGIINGSFIPQNGPEINAQVVINLTTNRVTSVWGIRETAGGQMPSEIEVQSGDQFRPSWISLNQENTFVPRGSNAVLTADSGASNFVYSLIDAPRGSFEIGVFTENLTGESSQNTVSVDVEDGGNTSFTNDLAPTQFRDRDGDTIPDGLDNCPSIANTLQRDTDFDARGDACDTVNNLVDVDGDGISDYIDNCPNVANPDQADEDFNFIGDACEGEFDGEFDTGFTVADGGCYDGGDTMLDVCNDDFDADGVADFIDNCPYTYNPNQQDSDFDFIGDACESYWATDSDGDEVPDFIDNCPVVANPQQYDSDYDGFGDACDTSNDSSDFDADGVDDSVDNCPYTPNPAQSDLDGNGFGDACDFVGGDWDNDGVLNTDDNCPDDYNPRQRDNNGDGIGDACAYLVEADWDDDAVPDFYDNCPYDFNPRQRDTNGDGIGDICEDLADYDVDDDGWDDWVDNCWYDYNPTQRDSDGDGVGDVCDYSDDWDGDGVDDDVDNCLYDYNPAQLDSDGDGVGNACSYLFDWDEDGINDDVDNCPYDYNPAQADANSDGIGNACNYYIDWDEDGVNDNVDNCPYTWNPRQRDDDGNGFGNACDSGADWDYDGINDYDDNCPYDYNPLQLDDDENGIGNACEYDFVDTDGDGWFDFEDNCPFTSNIYQSDNNQNGIGDACEVGGNQNDDTDDDGWVDLVDNCPLDYNPDQLDTNEDGIGDECDDTDTDADGLSDSYEYEIGTDPFNADTDGDGLFDGDELFYYFTNPNNPDTDGDGVNDGTEVSIGRDPTVNDNDSDGDGIFDPNDECPFSPGPAATGGCPDSDGDEVEDSVDSCPGVYGPPQTDGCPDSDGDGFADSVDNCPSTPNNQADGNNNNVGDACEDRDSDGFLDANDSCPDAGDMGFGIDGTGCPIPDSDGDGIADPADNCPSVPNMGQIDDDADGAGNACDAYPNDPDEF